MSKKPTVLMILDGYGLNDKTEGNAVAQAKTPVMDKLMAECPFVKGNASGMAVGLPDGQMGNSEVGHLNMGAGRIVYQELTRITKEIEDGVFFENEAFLKAVENCKKNQSDLHLFGLLSDGGVHSHNTHMYALLELAKRNGIENVYLHAFLDGRDTPPASGKDFVKEAMDKMEEIGVGQVATVMGRYYVMDRDNRWDRVEQAYDLLTQGTSQFPAYPSIKDAIEAAYARDENDEFVKASVIGEPVKMEDGDSLIFMNFRADRARQITRAFVNPDFDGFTRKYVPALADFVMLTQYAADIKTACAYPPEELTNTLGEWLSSHDKTQLRISETEKYAHVTFFFNGGVETQFPGEDRILIPSPKVATYDLQPEMSSQELTDKLCAAIESGKYDVVICNYPNGDMVGHTGVYEAAIKAVEAVDSCIGRVVESLKKVGGECLITADHGNCERMKDMTTGQPYTAHTNLPVPFIYVGRKAHMREGGRLSDIAPTMLYLLGMEIPKEMTGKSIVTLD